MVLLIVEWQKHLVKLKISKSSLYYNGSRFILLLYYHVLIHTIAMNDLDNWQYMQ